MIPAEGTMQNGHLINILALQSTSTYWYLISDLVSNTQCSGSPQICRLPSFPCYPLISLNVLKSKQALHYFQRAERPASWSCYQNQTGGGGGETLGLVTKFCLGPIPDSNPPMLLSGSSTSLIQGSLLFTLPGVGLPVWWAEVIQNCVFCSVTTDTSFPRTFTNQHPQQVAKRKCKAFSAHRWSQLWSKRSITHSKSYVFLKIIRS